MANSEYRIEGPSASGSTRYSLFAIRNSSHIPPVTGLAVLGVYLLTLRPEVGLGDEAELALQAYQLGVTHPPGYPVHTFLGKLLNFVVSEPALATNLLSAVCTSIAVAFLSAILLSLTRHRLAAVLGPLVFAFTPTVWHAAVTTEVYNINICMVAAALFFALRWHAKPSAATLCAAAVLLGVSLGSSLANLLLVPGFVVLITYGVAPYGVAPVFNRWGGDDANQDGRSGSEDPGGATLDASPGDGQLAARFGHFRHVALAAFVTAGTACVVLSWSYFRCASYPPLGAEWLPDTPGGFLRFVSGSQYTIPLSQPISFYVDRPLEHALYWSKSLLWLGALLGLWGLWLQWKQQRAICVALFVFFAMNLGYFTFYPWRDYREMVTPSYFVFALWIGHGICALDAYRAKSVARIAAGVVPMVVAGGLLISGMREHMPGKGTRPVTDFVRSSFEWFPPGAVVVARWYEFTALLYFQRTHGLRPDLTIIEHSDRPRHYQWGTVEEWSRYVYGVAPRRPVMVDYADPGAPGLRGRCEFTPAPGGWYRLTRAHSSGP